MIVQVLLSILIILSLFSVWVLVQHLARRFAARHPEFGPAREEGGECGISCGCSRRQRRDCTGEKPFLGDT